MEEKHNKEERYNKEAKYNKKEKHKKNLIEVIKFGIIGGLGYIGTVGTFNILLTVDFLHKRVLVVTIIANGLGILITWIGNSFWTWKDMKNESKLKEVAIYFALNILLVFFPVICVWVTVDILHHTSKLALNISANIIGIGIGTIIRYFVYKFILFSPKKKIIK